MKIGHCKDCKWRDEDGNCNNDKLHEDSPEYRSKANDHLIYSYYEGGDFWVGPDFGCVHFNGSDKNEIYRRQ